jgi:hypothetical protein
MRPNYLNKLFKCKITAGTPVVMDSFSPEYYAFRGVIEPVSKSG